MADVSAEEFVVEKIVGKGFFLDGVLKYRVRWKDYQPESDTWEPLENLTQCDDAIARFEKCLKKYIYEECIKKSGNVFKKECPENNGIIEFSQIYPIYLDPDDKRYSDSSLTEESSRPKIEYETLRLEDVDSLNLNTSIDKSSPHKKKKKSKHQEKLCASGKRRSSSSESGKSKKDADIKFKFNTASDLRKQTNSKSSEDKRSSRIIFRPKKHTGLSSSSSDSEDDRENAAKKRQNLYKKTSSSDEIKKKPQKLVEQMTHITSDNKNDDDDINFFGFDRGKNVKTILNYVRNLDAFDVVYTDGEEEYVEREVANKEFVEKVIEYYQRESKYVYVGGRGYLEQFVKVKSDKKSTIFDEITMSLLEDDDDDDNHCFEIEFTPRSPIAQTIHDKLENELLEVPIMRPINLSDSPKNQFLSQAEEIEKQSTIVNDSPLSEKSFLPQEKDGPVFSFDPDNFHF